MIRSGVRKSQQVCAVPVSVTTGQDTETQTHRDPETQTQTRRHRDTQTDRHTHTPTHTDTHTQTHTDTQTHNEIEFSLVQRERWPVASQGGVQPSALGFHVRKDTDSTASQITLVETVAWNEPQVCRGMTRLLEKVSLSQRRSRAR